MNNYKYCGVQNTCVTNNITCNNITKEIEYTNLTGCPVFTKCDIGLKGSLYIDTGLAATGGLDTSIDNSIQFKSLNSTTIANNASTFPCAMILYNRP